MEIGLDTPQKLTLFLAVASTFAFAEEEEASKCTF